MTQRITGHTELIGLLATPIRHSKSPAMHNAAFEKLGLDYAYLAFEFEPEGLEDAIKGLKALNVRGYNVSMPYKTAIIPLLDEISESSRLCQSVNTVVNDNGRLKGTITDGVGFMEAVKNDGVNIIGEKITVLGAGGVATAICMQAALDGVREISIFNKQDGFIDRVLNNIDKINTNTNCKAAFYPLEDQVALRREIADSVLLCNATNVGMGKLEGQCLIPDDSFLYPELHVFDVLYAPAETALLKMAREKGCHTMNGIHMMIYQGAAAFKLWTRQDMPIDYIKTIV